METTYRFTVADLERMDPQPWDDTRYEIIDGELHVSTQPSPRHQRTIVRIVRRLPDEDAGTGSGIAIFAPGLIFTAVDAVAPDIAWFANRARYLAALDADGKIRRAPDLVVEVLSPGRDNERRDRVLKLDTYGRFGVREYWLADWRGRRLVVYRHDGVTLQLTAKLGADDTLASPLMPGFGLRVGDLLAEEIG
jgi:Uma2 family endonuclease